MKVETVLLIILTATLVLVLAALVLVGTDVFWPVALGAAAVALANIRRYHGPQRP